MLDWLKLRGGKPDHPLRDAQAKHAARLQIHTADQSEKKPTKIVVTLNGQRMDGSLPAGLGIQRTDLAHLAFPATLEFQVSAANLRPGKNNLEVRVQDDGWFSWDAMDLTSSHVGEVSKQVDVRVNEQRQGTSK